MKRLIVRLEHIMNDFNLKKKLHILYIYCMLIPLIITDSVILFIVVQMCIRDRTLSGNALSHQKMENQRMFLLSG